MISPQKRLHNNVQGSMNSDIIGDILGGSWVNFVDFTSEDLMSHMESLFHDGMDWSNYGRGGWVMDHITPKAKFNYIKVSDFDFKECWSLSNLRPLWELDNIRKSQTLLSPMQLHLNLSMKGLVR
mgnify:CR=1 FL=1|jgi:hypothetical protein